jgi:hypothetical protein
MAVHHCAEHNHKVGWFGALMQGRKAARDPASQPPLPLFPHINSVDVVERLAGDVRFDGGTYDSTPRLPVTGEIAIEMSAGDSAKMLGLYRNKFRKSKYKLPADLPIALAAGFALIRGKAGLRFAVGQDNVLTDGMGLSFGAKSIVGHPVFENAPGRPPGEWRLSVGYEVIPERAPKEIPLWIVPSVTPSSDRRTLEIDLHWNQIDADGRKLNLTQFDLIELVVPAADWGAVQSVEPSKPNRPTIATGGGRRTIRWERVKPGNDKSTTLQLRFERKILPGPDDDESAARPDPTFSGTLRATFGQTLSGVEGIDIYLPGGMQATAGQQGQLAQGPEAKVRTEVTVSFEISLASLRYQDDWVVPDDSNARDARKQAQGNGSGEFAEPLSKTDELIGVIPDYRTVTELTNLISRESYYVKSVVEHLPYRDDGRGNVVNRVWDIAGRWYEGVFPIDFDINLRGEELGEVDPGGLIGRTIAQVTVKGSYVNDRELAQRKLIEEKWRSLHAHVTGLLGSRSRSGGGARAISSAEVGGGWGDLGGDVRGQGDDPSGDRSDRDLVVVDAEIVEPEPAATRPDNGSAQRVAELRKRQSDADDAVIAGRISENSHRDIVARIQAELRELGGEP